MHTYVEGGKDSRQMPEALVIRNPLHLPQLPHRGAHESRGPWSFGHWSLISVQIPGDWNNVVIALGALLVGLLEIRCGNEKSPGGNHSVAELPGLITPTGAVKTPSSGYVHGFTWLLFALHVCIVSSAGGLHLLAFPICRFPISPLRGLSPLSFF